jgi:hypothetical protein
VSRSIFFISQSLGALISGVLTAGALASDLTITSSISDTVELNDNPALRSGGPSSGILGSYSSSSLNALYKTPTTTFQVGGDLQYRKSFGPGAEGSSLSETTSDGLTMRFQKDGKTAGDVDYVAATYRRTDAALLQQQDIGVASASAPVTGDLIYYSASGGGSRRLNNTDSFNWSVNGNWTTYSPSGGGATPFASYTGGVGWNHRVSPLIDFSASSSLSWQIYDNIENTKTLSSTTTGGLTMRLSDRLTASARAGVAIYKTTQDTAGPVSLFPVSNDPLTNPLLNASPAVAGTTVGPVIDLSMSYKLLKFTQVSASASQAVTPGTLGGLSKRTSITVSLDQTINSSSSLSFTGNLSRFEPPSGGGGTTDLYLLSGTYSYRLTREWRASASYIYRVLSTGDTTPTTGDFSGFTPGTNAHSNSVLFVIARDFTLKP